MGNATFHLKHSSHAAIPLPRNKMAKAVMSCLILLIAGCFLSANSVAQSAGFNSTYFIINNGASNTYYDLQANTANPDFNGANLGTFCAGSVSGLTFKGAEHNVYKCGGCDLT